MQCFSDGHSQIELVWFRGHKWIQEQLKLNTPYVAFGRLSLWFGNRANMPHPELTLEAEYEASKIGALHPVYPSEKLTNKGVTQRIMKQMMVNLFRMIGNQFKENLPDYLLAELQLISRKEAIINAFSQ